jgi:hypothetical protein
MASRIRIAVTVLSIFLGAVGSTPAGAGFGCEEPPVPPVMRSHATYADTDMSLSNPEVHVGVTTGGSYDRTTVQ